MDDKELEVEIVAPKRFEDRDRKRTEAPKLLISDDQTIEEAPVLEIPSISLVEDERSSSAVPSLDDLLLEWEEEDGEDVVELAIPLDETTVPVNIQSLFDMTEDDDNELALMVPGDQDDDEFSNEDQTTFVRKTASEQDLMDTVQLAKEETDSYVTILQNINRMERRNVEKQHKFLGELIESSNLPDINSNQISKIIQLLGQGFSSNQIFENLVREDNISPRVRQSLLSSIERMHLQYQEKIKDLEVQAGLSDAYNNNKSLMKVIQRDINLLVEARDSMILAAVRSVKMAKDYSLMECGSCQGITKINGSFLTMFVHENLMMNPLVKVLPKGHKCTTCGKVNILEAEYWKPLAVKLSDKYKGTTRKWMTASYGKLSVGSNMILGTPSKVVLLEALPAIFSDLVEEDLTPVTEEMNLDEIMRKWARQTDVVLESLTAYVPPKQEFNVEDRTIVLDDEQFNELKVATKSIASLMKEDYDSLYRFAINTLLMNIEESYSLYSTLSEEYDTIHRAMEYSSSLLNLELEDESEVYRDLSILYDVDYEVYEKQGREVANKVILERLERINELHSQRLEQREIAYKTLESSLKYVAFTSISRVKSDVLTKSSYLLSNPRLVKWLDRAANLMVIHRISEPMRTYWASLRIPSYGNKSLFNPKSIKPMAALLDRFSKEYSVYLTTRFPVMRPTLSSVLSTFTCTVEFVDTIPSLVTDLYDAVDTDDLHKASAAIQALANNDFVRHMPLAGMEKVLSDMYNSSIDFLTTNGLSTLDYYRYHYGDQFTDEEMSFVEEVNIGMSRPYYTFKREEGEDFRTFLERVKTENPSKTNLIKREPVRELDALRPYALLLFGLKNRLALYQSNMERPREEVFMFELIYYGIVLGSDRYTTILGIPKPNDRIRKNIPEVKVIDLGKTELATLLKNCVYPSSEINLILKEASPDYPSLDYYISENPVEFVEIIEKMGALGDEYALHSS